MRYSCLLLCTLNKCCIPMISKHFRSNDSSWFDFDTRFFIYKFEMDAFSTWDGLNDHNFVSNSLSKWQDGVAKAISHILVHLTISIKSFYKLVNVLRLHLIVTLKMVIALVCLNMTVKLTLPLLQILYN